MTYEEASNMEDKRFLIYANSTSSLDGNITDGCLSLLSEVYGADYDSEKHYKLTKEETDKLFSVITFEDFIDFCRKEMTLGLEELLSYYDIKYESFTI